MDAALPTRSVLVVEDDQDIRQLLQLHLEEQCSEVACAADGVEGLRLAPGR